MRRRGREIARIGGLLAAAALALPAAAGAATFDVNDDANAADPGPAGAACGTPDFTGTNPNPIQEAISFAATAPDGGDDDVIRVCAGTYSGTITVPSTASGMTLLGAQTGADARARGVPQAEESLVTAATSGAGLIVVEGDATTIDGFDISDVNNGEDGISTAALSSGHRLVNNILRSNSNGIELNNAPAAETLVRHNLLDSNNDVGIPSGNGIYGDEGTSNVRIDENRFTGHSTAAISLNFPVGGSDVTVSDNDLVSDGGILLHNTTTATIEGNTSTGSQGSAIVLNGGNDGVTVQRNRLTGGTASGVRVFDTAGPNTNLSVLGNTILDNAFGIRVSDGALNGELEAHFNRIAGNGTGVVNDDPDVGDFVDAANNWWGCSEGPGLSGCDMASGNPAVVSSPWLVLGLSAAPTSISATGTASIVARLTRNSDNVTVGVGFPNGTPVSFAATLGTIGSPVPTSGGLAAGTFTAAGQGGTATVSGSLDNETASTGLVISPPAEAAATTTRPKRCKKKKFREKHPKKCGKKKTEDKKRKRR